MYKTKETAIKHIENGANFETNAFKLFRDDKDVVLEAVKRNNFDSVRVRSWLVSVRRISEHLFYERVFFLEHMSDESED